MGLFLGLLNGFMITKLRISFLVVTLGTLYAFRGLAFAYFPVVFPGIENQMQPRHHLFDRRQLAGRTSLAARTGFNSSIQLAKYSAWRSWPCTPR